MENKHTLLLAFFSAIFIMILVSSPMRDKSIKKRKTIQETPETRSSSPESSSTTIQCLERVLFNLPFSDGKYYAHHWDAHTGKWNEDIRFEPMDLPEEKCVVLDIGGNTDAADTNKLLRVYPQCIFHVFEPVPPFFAKPEKTYQDPHFDGKIFLHNVGLGRKNAEVGMFASEVNGQSTFLGKNNEKNQRHKNEKTWTLSIRNMETILTDLYGLEDPSQKVSLLHMNCEGCEWETLLSMGERGLFERFEVIQFGTHNYGEEGVGVRSWQLCQIRDYLSKTHRVVSEVPFGWERWVSRS